MTDRGVPSFACMRLRPYPQKQTHQNVMATIHNSAQGGVHWSKPRTPQTSPHLPTSKTKQKKEKGGASPAASFDQHKVRFDQHSSQQLEGII